MKASRHFIIFQASNPAPGLPNKYLIKMQRKPRNPLDPRPNIPNGSSSKDVVEVWYDYDEMTITFTVAEGDCAIAVYNDDKGTMKKYRVSTIQTGDIRKGRIRMLTEAGNEYVGTVY